LGVVYKTSDAWNTRMSTITAGAEDGSIGVRLAVWKWTYDYALAHPLGGGFDVYFIDSIDVQNDSRPTGIETIAHRAFHSIYFEVLGEQGFIGLGMFLSIAGLSFLSLMGVIRRTKGNPELRWCNDLAKALLSALTILMTCGAFIGIAFQPFLYYLFAITVSLREWVHRTEEEPAPAFVPALA